MGNTKKDQQYKMQNMEEHFRNILKEHTVEWDKEDLLPGLESSMSRTSWYNTYKKWLLLLPIILLVTCLGRYSVHKKTTNSQVAINTNYTNGHRSGEPTKQRKEKEGTFVQNNIVAKRTTNAIQNEPRNISKVAYRNTKQATSSSLEQSSNIVSFSATSDDAISENANTIRNIPLEHATSSLIPRTINVLQYADIEWNIAQSLTNIVPTEIPSAAKVKFYVQPMINTGYFHRQIKSPHNNKQSVIDRTTVKPILFDAVSLAIGMKIQDKWTIETGIEYLEFRDYLQLDVNIQADTMYKEYDKAIFFLDSNNDSVFVAADRPFITNQSREIRHRNRLRYFNVPLNVGYNFKINNVRLHATAGVSFAFADKYTGRNNNVRNDGTVNIIENVEMDMEHLLGFQLGLGWEYPLSRKTKFMVNANVRRSPHFNLYLAEIPYKEIYWSYSLGAGVRFDLGD